MSTQPTTPEEDVRVLYGKPRPKESHYSAIFDEAFGVGRTDVSDVVFKAIQKIPAERRLYPDLYAHLVTKALINAGVIDPDVDEEP